MDQSPLRDGHIYMDGIHKQKVRLGLYLFHCALHSQAGSLIYVDTVNLEWTGCGNRPRESSLLNNSRQFLSLFGSEELAVVQSAYRPIGIQDRGGGKNGTEQTPSPHLIHTADKRKTRLAGFTLVCSGAAEDWRLGA
jgi:hypothetical protein